ncbi:helix-turn-helix domain-containing protein [Parasphingorhabdus pacifica]
MSADVGQRIKAARQRAGMSRPVLAGLVGRTPEWLKAVEVGRLRTPRLPMLVQLARALGISDLADLTGNGDALPVQMFVGGPKHEGLGDVQSALTAYRLTPSARPAVVEHLGERLSAAWRIRHASPDHRTQVGALLPDLVRDGQDAVLARTGPDRRAARRILAGIYRLAQFYAAYQPAPELVWLVADRALHEAQLADDAYAMASGSWGLVQVLRESGRWEEALGAAEAGTRYLKPHLSETVGDDWHGLTGALLAESALTYARCGKHGPAWRYWELAHAIARKLGPDYCHVQSSFSLPVMGAHAVTLGVELQRNGEALQAGHAIDPSAIPSVPRRSRHLIEVARAHHKRDEPAASLATLERAESTATDTVRYNGFARDLAIGLVHSPPPGKGQSARALAHRMGLLAR